MKTRRLLNKITAYIDVVINGVDFLLTAWVGGIIIIFDAVTRFLPKQRIENSYVACCNYLFRYLNRFKRTISSLASLCLILLFYYKSPDKFQQLSFIKTCMLGIALMGLPRTAITLLLIAIDYRKTSFKNE